MERSIAGSRLLGTAGDVRCPASAKWSPSASEGDAWLPTPLWCCSRCSEGRTIASPRSVAERTLPQRDSGRIE